MRKILKKSIIFILSLLLFMSWFSFIACSTSNNEFETVSKVTFVSGGKDYSFSSTLTYNRRSKVYIDKEEFDDAPESDKYIFESREEESWFMDEKGSSRMVWSKSEVEGLEGLSALGDTPKGSPIYTCTITKNIFGTSYDYKKYTFISNIYSLVQVKVENDTTIVIKNSTSTTTYQVTSYSITYLD